MLLRPAYLGAPGTGIVYGGGSDADRDRLNAIRTAGTIVVGAGGAMALLLAARRQRSTEIALKHGERVAEDARLAAAASPTSTPRPSNNSAPTRPPSVSTASTPQNA